MQYCAEKISLSTSIDRFNVKKFANIEELVCRQYIIWKIFLKGQPHEKVYEIMTGVGSFGLK
jgi:hypothetical protein